jgi:hypothetical protein
VIFCPISEAVRDYPDLVQQYLGSVVPISDNFFAALNSAVFTDGSFCYVPKGVRCPMELSTYFRINARSTGQFERTLIIADPGSYVSYLEGCTAPMRDENQLHAAVVELVAHDDAQIKYSTGLPRSVGDGAGRACRRGRVPGVPVSGGTAGRRQCQLHAHGAERVAPLARRSRAGCGAVSPTGAGRDEAAGNARGHAAAERQCRLLRRREEAQ